MHLEATKGWLELGDYVSALQELEKISGLRRAQPDVLKLRLQIYVKARRWRNAYAIAQGLTHIHPVDCEVLVWRSQAARWMPGGGLRQALIELLEIANDFPDEPAIPFYLACYNCQMGNEATARSWLRLAFEAAQRSGTTAKWQIAMAEERDLEPLRKKDSAAPRLRSSAP
jgi:uncharacterized protein HemY